MENNIYTINPLSKDAPVEIFGHWFNGLSEVRRAINYFMRDGRPPFLATGDFYQPVEGVYILCNYEPYPTFDSYDSMSENRDYENYFIKSQPFDEQDFEAVAAMRSKKNHCKVYEGMTMPDGMVIIYYEGDGDTMLLAYQS